MVHARPCPPSSYTAWFLRFLRAAPPAAGNGSQNFALFLFTGLVVWLFFAGMINGSMGWLGAIGDLRRRFSFPLKQRYLAAPWLSAVQSAIEAGVLLIVMLLVGNIGLSTLALPFILVLAGIFGLGIGFFVCVLNTHYRDVQYLVGIILNALFFVPIRLPDRNYPRTTLGRTHKKNCRVEPGKSICPPLRESRLIYCNGRVSLDGESCCCTRSRSLAWDGDFC